MARKKKVTTKKTEIIAVLDRSGSMATIIDDAIGGFNTFLEEQKAIPGEARLTQVQFDDQYEMRYQALPLESAEPLTSKTYVPRGMTALLDAVGRTISSQKARIDAEKWADVVVLVIVTDGMENSSREFTYDSLKTVIAEAEKADWKIVYVGANQDALTVAKDMGIVSNIKNTQNYDATSIGTRSVYQSISSTTSSFRA